MKDKYTISAAHHVPANIIRPSYVGIKHQYHSLDGKPYVIPPEKIPGMKAASKLAARTLKHALDNTKPFMTLDEIDKIVHDFIVADGSYPSAIDFMGFPKSVCLSVNDVVSHGVPNNY